MSYLDTLKLQQISNLNDFSDTANSITPALIEQSLLLINAGRLTTATDVLLPGSILFLASDQIEQLTYHCEISDDFSAWYLRFCPGCLHLNNHNGLTQQFLQARLGFHHIRTHPKSKDQSDSQAYLNCLFSQLMRQYQHLSTSKLEVVRSLVLLILEEICQTSSEQQKLRLPPKVIEALLYIEQHFNQPISLKDVAKRVHASAPHLATQVKKYTQLSIGDWISYHRLSLASRLLSHSQEPIEQVAQQCGWGDTTHFIRLFKKHKGKTPLQWRKSMA